MERPVRTRRTRSAEEVFREDYLRAEQKFRHEEGRAITRMAARAQLYAFTLAVLFLIAGTIVVLLGHDVAGAAIAATASVSLATAFLAGSAGRRRSAEAEASAAPAQAELRSEAS